MLLHCIRLQNISDYHHCGISSSILPINRLINADGRSNVCVCMLFVYLYLIWLHDIKCIVIAMFKICLTYTYVYRCYYTSKCAFYQLFSVYALKQQSVKARCVAFSSTTPFSSLFFPSWFSTMRQRGCEVWIPIRKGSKVLPHFLYWTPHGLSSGVHNMSSGINCRLLFTR